MKEQRWLWSLTLVFFGTMLILTAFSRSIHNSSLVKVQTTVPDKKVFSLTEGGKTIRSKCYALSPEAVELGAFYVYSAEKNGDTRTFVRQATVILGDLTDGYYPVLDGEYHGEPVVVGADGALADGQEVVVSESN